MAGIVPGGWPEVMERNHALVMIGRQKLLEVLRTAPVAPESMVGSIAAVELADSVTPAPVAPAADADPHATHPLDPLRDALSAEDGLEVPVFSWPHTPADVTPRRRLLRISAQLYNSAADYDRLASALAARQHRRAVEPDPLAEE
jgi:isopenicillin-N epimerase